MKTPVAFLIFNRPDTTERVFELIRQAKPLKLLVVADGPRADRVGEAEKCAAARAIIDRVDWKCQVIKNYSSTNLGCKQRVSTGLNWVFDTVEEAIILEDDCLPHYTFFQFCEELLDRYRDDKRVMHIAGNTFGITSNNSVESYYFSKSINIWGWATWKRAWQHYDVDISFWPEILKENRLLDLIDFKDEAQARHKDWERVYAKKIDTWDYQWFLTCLCQGGYAVVPSKNLISNIGFNQDATHTTDSGDRFANLNTCEVEFPLIHPKFVVRYKCVDRVYFERVYKIKMTTKIRNKFMKMKKEVSAF